MTVSMAMVGTRAISLRKGVDCSSTNPICQEKRWPRNSKEVGAAGLHREKSREWIDEEGEEDGCGAVNKELGGIEDKLKKQELCGM